MAKAPDWAWTRTEELSLKCVDETNFPMREAFARYIAEHEEPHVDQDALDVREIIDAWCEPSGGGYNHIVKVGEADNSPGFQSVLAKYRELKARDRG